MKVSYEDVCAVQAAVNAFKTIISKRTGYVHDEYATRPSTIQDAVATAKLALPRLEEAFHRLMDIYEDDE